MAEATPQATGVTINAGRLKYADPRDLPSFPSTGLRPDGAAAGAAATLGWNNQKPVELWKPDKISSASAAAVLAKDYKMTPQWEPSSNSAGHKAALLAVGSANTALKHHPSSSSPKNQHEGWGNSAATQAFHASRPVTDKTNDLSHGGSAATQAFIASRSQSVRVSSSDNSPSTGDRSLLAAQGAMNIQRAHSKTAYSREQEDLLQSSAAFNALNGAARAHQAALAAKPIATDTGAVPVTTMTRNMFTSHPMVKAETDEQGNNQRLHQSAIEMAKKMYNTQQKMLDQAKETHGDEAVNSQPPPYLNLQDAAYKQAQERLAKLHDEHQKSRELQEYYGNAQVPRRRFTVTNRLRRKNSDEEFDDRAQSQKIRQQMSMFSNKLSEVDKSKRQQDRDALLAAAQRNVKARLHGMDEKVYRDTGKVNPTLLSEWEVKAQQAAQARSEDRNENKGKVDLGGGMFMDRDDVDAIAAKRMQPIIDDINTKAEAERERLAALKLAEEARREEAEKQKIRDREIKELNKRIKEEEKQDQRAKRRQAKDEEKARRDQEKAEREEQRHRNKEEKRRSKHDPAGSDAAADQIDHDEDGRLMDDGYDENLDGAYDKQQPQGTGVIAPKTGTNLTSPDHVQSRDTNAERINSSSGEQTAVSKTKMRTWIKNRLSIGKPSEGTESAVEDERQRRGSNFFRGGVSSRKPTANDSMTSLEHRSASMRDVAMAGKTRESETREVKSSGSEDSRGVSPISSLEETGQVVDAEHDGESLNIVPPRPIEDLPPRSSVSSNRDSRFREEMGP